ncbi:TPA: phage tail protein [Salmonella enterica subsp. enterica serovar Derby]
MPVARYLCIFINVGLGEGSALPVGVPVPWPSATPPTGWLKCNGAPFSAEEYPKLAKVYPTNELPDLRGEFIRGWDDGRGVDAGRALLSIQTGMLEKHRHIVVANDWYDSKEEWELATIFRRAYTQGRGLDAADVGGTLIPSPTLHTRGSIGNTGGSETRPRNIAFNFIVRAA